MEKALNFLLQNWLMIGLEVLIFFGIGLILAKLIWGRHHQRLFAAIDENMNLAGQWQALGGAQRDLFKKLRSRWQEDRDSWESQLEEFSKRLKIKSERIAELESESKSHGKETVSPDHSPRFVAAEARVAELEELLEKKEEEIDGLNHSLELRAETEEVRTLRARVSDLEQDLVNAHDELHDLRSNEPESRGAGIQEADLTAGEAANASEESGGKGEKEGRNDEGIVKSADDKRKRLSRTMIQLEALLKQRSRELKALRREREARPAPEVTAERSPEDAKATDWKAKAVELQEALDQQVDEHAESVQGLYQQITHLENELQNKEDQLSSRVESGTIGNLLAQNANVESGGEEEDRESTPMPVPLFVSSTPTRDLEADSTDVDKERIIEALKSELTDALDEMRDVRKGYNRNFAEIEVLQARLEKKEISEVPESEDEGISPEEFASAQQQIEELKADLEKSGKELAEAQRNYKENHLELTDLRNQVEELEAIVEERNEEVNTVTSELESQRETIRNLRVKVAQQEGDLEGLNEQNHEMIKEVAEKTSIAEFLTARIEEVELALGERYEEMNQLSLELEKATTTLQAKNSYDEGIAREISELKWDNGLLVKQVAELETKLEEATSELEAITPEVEERRQKALLLEDRFNLMKMEATEKADALQLAESELAAAHEQLATLAERDESFVVRLGELEEEKASLEAELQSVKDRVESCEEVISDREETIGGMRETLDSALSENEDMKSRLSGVEEDRDAIDADRGELARALETKTNQLGDFSDRINRLVHGGFQGYEGDDSGSGGSASTVSNFYHSDDEQINALGSAIAILESRAVDAEQNFGSCEKELVILREEIIELKQTHQIQLGSRVEEVEALQAELEEARREVDRLHRELEEKSAIEEEFAARDESSSHLKELVESLRNDLSSKQLAIRELEDQLAYERDREVFRDQEVSDPVPVEELNRVEAVSDDRVEDGGPGSLRIYFNEGVVALNGESMDRIDRVALQIRNQGGSMKLSVIGFAGSEGSAAMNESLSARRADAVRERLMENGVSQSLISVQSAGEDESISRTEPENSWKARRVEVTLVPEAVAESIN